MTSGALAFFLSAAVKNMPCLGFDGSYLLHSWSCEKSAWETPERQAFTYTVPILVIDVTLLECANDLLLELLGKLVVAINKIHVAFRLFLPVVYDNGSHTAVAMKSALQVSFRCRQTNYPLEESALIGLVGISTITHQ